MYDSAYNIKLRTELRTELGDELGAELGDELRAELKTELTGIDTELADRFHKNGVILGESILDCLYDHSSAIKGIMGHYREVAGLLLDGVKIGRRHSEGLSKEVVDRAFRTAQAMHEEKRGWSYENQIADLHFNDYQGALDYLKREVQEIEQGFPKHANLAKSFCSEGIKMGEKALRVIYEGELSLVNPLQAMLALNRIKKTGDNEFMDMAFPFALATAKIMHDLFLNYQSESRLNDLQAILRYI